MWPNCVRILMKTFSKWNVGITRNLGSTSSWAQPSTLKQLLIDKVMSFVLMEPHKNKKTGDLKIIQCQINEKLGFIDYLRGGEQLNMMIAIDFIHDMGKTSLLWELEIMNLMRWID